MTQTVRVPLASNTLYVRGTVNGVDKVWTREEGNWWSTTADRADDGVYRVALSIVYEDGQTASDSVTLYYGLVLITDRTQADVDAGLHPGATTGPSGGNKPVSPGTPGSESIVGKQKGWETVTVKEPGKGTPGVDGADGVVVIYWDKEAET